MGRGECRGDAPYQRRPRPRRPHRRGRDDQPAPPGKRRQRERRDPGVLGRDPPLYPTGLPFSRDRSAVDQFPPAALDPVDAGRRPRRPRPHQGRLCSRGRRALSVLLVWRRLPDRAPAKGRDAMKPFRFGISVWHVASRAELADKAKKVEALGYDTLSFPDHLNERIAPLPALVAAAAATSRLRLGTNVLNNNLRHPVLVAREAAAVDLLTDGRLQLGLGAGSIKSEYDEVGLSFDTGATRVERLTEAVTIIKGLLNGEAVTFAGQHYQIAGHTIAPLPIQKPHPPILIGGNGRRLLTLAAREADIVGFSGITFRDGGASPPDLSAWRIRGVDERVRWLREGAGEQHFARLEIGALIQRVLVTDKPRATAEELSGRWPQLNIDDILQTPYLLIGSAQQMAENLVARRDRWGISYYVLRETYLDDFAPVVAQLAGT